MTTNLENGSVELVRQLWHDASLQIVAPVSAIRLNTKILDSLGDRGMSYFILHCSLLLAKPAEFVLDNSNPDRIYLGNARDLEEMLDAVIIRGPTDKFPVLYPRHPLIY